MESVKLNQLKQQYEQAVKEEDKIDLLVEIALIVRTDDPERALAIAEEIINRSQVIGYAKGIGNGLNHKGACYWLIGEYEDGLDELTAALSIAKEIKDDELEAKVYNNFGRIYRELGDIATSLRNFEHSLELNEKIKNELNLTINLTNISNLYYDLGDYDTALEYAIKCLPIFERYSDNSRLISIYTTLGNIYFKKEEFKKSLFYFESLQKISEPESVSRGLADSGVGKVYYKMHDYEKAVKFLYLSNTHSKEIGNPEIEIIASYYLGLLYRDQHIFKKSLEYLLHAYHMAQEYMRKQDLLSVHEALSDLYDLTNDIPKAYHHLKAYEKLKEEIFQQATLNKLRNLQVKNQIEVAKKEKEVAERTALLKQQFMANMSHEIRTPMNAIVGITHLLIQDNPSEGQLKYLNVIQKAADNLLVIINDILDLSKLEAGKVIIEDTSFSMSELTTSITEIMRMKAEEKGLSFQVQVDDKIPNRLIGDPTRLNQVLINLIGNAVKFTEKGKVELQCKLKKREDEKVHVTFDIIDTGIGISEDYVLKIFESFTQAGTDTARKYGGTGLGLTISKQLVDLMQGAIYVESELGVGTTFSIVIPFKIDHQEIKLEAKDFIEKDDFDQLNHIHILLAEDNEFNQMVAVDTLKSYLPGIKIDVATNGKKAVEMLKAEHYDLILMDIQMPVMDGVEATQMIRNELPAPKSQVKIIAMTANVLQEDVDKYMESGMNAYISKPFKTEELLMKMLQLINNSNQEEKLHQKQVQQQEAPFELNGKITDMRFLEQFTSGNKDKKKKYIQMFLTNTPRLLHNINEGLKNKDFESIKVAAHSLKPQLSYMGVTEEMSQIYLIEKTAAEQAHNSKLPVMIERLNLVCNKSFEELNNEIIA